MKSWKLIGSFLLSVLLRIVPISSRLKTQKRLLVITDLAIYTLMADSQKIKRRIPYSIFGSLCLSCLQDNFFILRVPTEVSASLTYTSFFPEIPQADLLFVSSRKTEITILISEAYKQAMHADCSVVFSNMYVLSIFLVISHHLSFTRLDFRNEDKVVREVRFIQNEGFDPSLFVIYTS